MGTMIGTEVRSEKVLEHLLEYEYDVLEAYRAAKGRLSHSEEVAMVGSFEREHLEQIQILARIARTAVERLPREGDWRQILTEGKVVIAGLVGELAVLRAVSHNERNVLNAYERASLRKDLPEEVRAVLMLHRNGARRRHKWLSERVEQLTS